MRHYDVIVLGSCLGSRIASTLLAKEGIRILTFAESPGSLPLWLHSSLHLERLLEQFGGRSCFTSPLPFQVVTGQSRIDIHGIHPFSDELRREFPDSFTAAESLLNSLQKTGEDLEETLWDAGGLPLAGYGSRWRFALKKWRHGLGMPHRTLSRPLRDFFADLQHPAKESVSAMFGGLSLVKFTDLSMAEGALLWSGIRRKDGVSRSGLDELLRRRYEQYHGEAMPLDHLQSLRWKGSALEGVTLKDGRTCTARYFLLGPQEKTQAQLQWAKDRPVPPPRCFRYKTSPLDGMISPLLTSRVIVGDNPPLRLSFTSADDRAFALIEYSPGRDMSPVDESEIRRRLTPVLPFAHFTLEQEEENEGPVESSSLHRKAPFPGARFQLHRRNQLFCCGAAALPSLGATAEVLVGRTAAICLLRRLRKKKF
jgi:hypothetical protein